MWELSIRGVDFYHLMNWFFIYSFFGWLWETCYVSAKNGKLVNRGFVNGPVCTIYGCGALCVYLILKPVSENLLWLFLGGIVVATALEYVTAVLMESIFHTTWWDYSDNRFNFQGRICLGASLGWGFLTVLLFRILHPMVEKIVALYPVYIGEIAVCVFSVTYVVDFCYSAAAAFKLHERLPVIEQAVEQAKDELLLKMHERMLLAGSQREATLENMKERLEDIEVLRELDAKREALKAELMKEVERRKKATAAKLGHNVSRFVNAYPNLNRGYKIRKRRHDDKKKNA